MFLISPIQRYWINHWKPKAFDQKMVALCKIGLILCAIFAYSLCFGEMVRESIIVGGQLDHIYVDDGLPPSPPTGVRVIQSGEIEERFEDYAPTGDIRMKDGQGDWIEYDINMQDPDLGGSVEGAYYE